TPIVELRGDSAGAGANGFTLSTSDSTIRGFIINRFVNDVSGGGNGIVITGAGATGNVIEGNYIGTDAAGSGAAGNASYGILLDNGAGNTTIGGLTTVARNVVSGNQLGIGITSGSTGTVVQGNYIGTDVTGTSAVPNATGLSVVQASTGNTIGGTT